jgi:hypothetical protein
MHCGTRAVQLSRRSEELLRQTLAARRQVVACGQRFAGQGAGRPVA